MRFISFLEDRSDVRQFPVAKDFASWYRCNEYDAAFVCSRFRYSKEEEEEEENTNAKNVFLLTLSVKTTFLKL